MTENNIENSGKGKNSIKNFIYEWGIPIISAFIIAFLINKFVLFKSTL